MKLKRLTTKEKKNLTSDWEVLFPSMQVYDNLSMGRIVGPIIQGIHLQLGSDHKTYKPILHLHNLTRDRDSVSLTFGQRPKSIKTDGPEIISIRFHENRYKEVACDLIKQAWISLDGDISIRDINSAAKNYLLENPYDIIILEDIITYYVWLGLTEIANSKIKEFNSAINEWPEYVSERIGGAEAWSKKMQNFIKNSDNLNKDVENNIEKLQLSLLPRYKLTT